MNRDRWSEPYLNDRAYFSTETEQTQMVLNIETLKPGDTCWIAYRQYKEPYEIRIIQIQAYDISFSFTDEVYKHTPLTLSKFLFDENHDYRLFDREPDRPEMDAAYEVKGATK